MEIVVELFNEYLLAHPHIPHVFAIPHLMTHLWRKQSYKDAYIFFIVNMGPSFWPQYIHEPPTMLILLPLAHVPN